MGNAIKFSPEGGTVKLNARLLQNEAKRRFLAFSVSDQGGGIPRSDHHLLFEKFSQTSKCASGSGLGLSICRKILNLIGGDIWIDGSHGDLKDDTARLSLREVVENDETRSMESVRRVFSQNTNYFEDREVVFTGALFHFMIPFCGKDPMSRSDSSDDGDKSEAETSSRMVKRRTLHDLFPNAPSTALQESIVTLCGRLKILVVEDNVINQKVLCKMLSNVLDDSIESSITIAENGAQAVEKASESEFHIIFMGKRALSNKFILIP